MGWPDRHSWAVVENASSSRKPSLVSAADEEHFGGIGGFHHGIRLHPAFCRPVVERIGIPDAFHSSESESQPANQSAGRFVQTLSTPIAFQKGIVAGSSTVQTLTLIPCSCARATIAPVIVVCLQ